MSITRGIKGCEVQENSDNDKQNQNLNYDGGEQTQGLAGGFQQDERTCIAIYVYKHSVFNLSLEYA